MPLGQTDSSAGRLFLLIIRLNLVSLPVKSKGYDIGIYINKHKLIIISLEAVDARAHTHFVVDNELVAAEFGARKPTATSRILNH